MSLIIMEKDSFWSYRDNFLIFKTLGTPECLDIMTSRHISLQNKLRFQNKCIDQNAFRKTEMVTH